MRVHAFIKAISAKVNEIARLDFELFHFDSTTHHFIHLFENKKKNFYLILNLKKKVGAV